ncbi:F-box protein GID2-like protein [Tanacetum coccineum]
MKRSISFSSDPSPTNDVDNKMKKKIREDLVPEEVELELENMSVVLSDDNLLYEILKHVDARALGSAGCVNHQWNRTAQDERLWELICTQHWANNTQLRSVVLALGGFKRLHSQYLWPLSKPNNNNNNGATSSSPVASVWPCLPPPRSIASAKPAAVKKRWGKDEVQLSLSLLSIKYYEKMNFSNRK